MTPGIGHNNPPADARIRREIARDLGEYTHDPYGFVLWAFPWGKPGTPLADEEGPDTWQRDELEEIGRNLRDDPLEPVRIATSSGHGIGKTTEVSWVILWALMTFKDMHGVVTANTATQLSSKTWAELAKWYDMLHPVLKEMFTLTATSIFRTGRKAQWSIDAIPNNPNNAAAFAGQHTGTRTLFIFDEASEIADVIHETTEGAFTDKKAERIWLQYGNPTINTGRFKECIEGKHRLRWSQKKIDSRTVKRTDKTLIQSWVDTYGADSDFVRVRVKGQFPRLGSMQLIPSDLVAGARQRQIGYLASDPLVAGLDIARYGDDRSVLQARQGRNARILPTKFWDTMDLMQLAGEVALWCATYKPHALFVDIGGLGAGVYDRLVQLQIPNVFPVNFGSSGREVDWGDPRNPVTVRTANMRASMWSAMRQWLQLGCIPDEQDLEDELVGVQYQFNADNAIQLEAKEHMKKRGVASPDWGDALALTFAMPVAPVQPGKIASTQPRTGVATEYDVHAPVNAQLGVGSVTEYDIHRDT